MKGLKSPYLSMVKCPCLTAIEENGQADCSVYIDFCFNSQVSVEENSAL